MAEKANDTELIDDAPANEEESPVEDTDEPVDDADSGEGEGTVEDGTDEEDDDSGDLIEDEDDEEGKDAGTLALDPKVAKALPEDVRKRYEQQAAGLNKLRTKLQDDEKLLGSYREWDTALNTKATAANALQNLVKGVSEAHGIDIAELFPQTKAKADAGTEEGDALEYESDRKVVDKAVNDAVKRMTDSLGMDPKDVKAFIDSQKTGEQKAKAEREKTDRIETLLPRIQRTLKARNDGWQPSPDAIRKALAEGDLSSDGKALESVRMRLYRDLNAHTAKRSRTEPGPDRLTGAKAPGKSLSKDPLKASALDYVT